MSKRRIILFGIAAILIAFLTWLAARVVTMDTELDIIVSYSIPEGNDLNNLADLDDAAYAVAVDGTVVDKNSDSPLPTASTAKIITALAVMNAKPFEYGANGENIVITDEYYDIYRWYVNNNGSNTRVEIGEEISQYDALASILMASSNNMADALAIWAFGSIEDYRNYAMKMLDDYNIKNTTIGDDASGYSSSTTSTPDDLAKIGNLLMQNPVLKEIVGTKEREVPVTGVLSNTNTILGMNDINGIKTGYIGDVSGYCLISNYEIDGHNVTTALLGAPTRAASFDESLNITRKIQSLLANETIVEENEIVAYYESWWSGKTPIRASETLSNINWKSASKNVDVAMNNKTGTMKLMIDNSGYNVPLKVDNYEEKPTFWQKIMHVFGWKHNEENDNNQEDNSDEKSEAVVEPTKSEAEILAEENAKLHAITNIPTDNYTVNFGYLMLINPNFTVGTDFIDARRGELVSISELYGIVEGNPYNGDNLLDPEAATHINDMVKAYEAEYPGHTLETRSCYRARGTTCGRLCAATGASDHHTGLTCDLLDPAYGTSLDTDTYDQHIDWQWLRANSYKYGFIDRFPYEWAGGPMSAPLNVDENGSTGLFETWHYRFVGLDAAAEIANGKYNNGEYDSLEHYLKARDLITDLKNGN